MSHLSRRTTIGVVAVLVVALLVALAVVLSALYSGSRSRSAPLSFGGRLTVTGVAAGGSLRVAYAGGAASSSAIYVTDVVPGAGARTTPVLPRGSWTAIGLSPDGRAVAGLATVSSPRRATGQELMVSQEAPSGWTQPRLITLPAGQEAVLLSWAPDGRGFVVEGARITMFARDGSQASPASPAIQSSAQVATSGRPAPVTAGSVNSGGSGWLTAAQNRYRFASVVNGTLLLLRKDSRWETYALAGLLPGVGQPTQVAYLGQSADGNLRLADYHAILDPASPQGLAWSVNVGGARPLATIDPVRPPAPVATLPESTVARALHQLEAVDHVPVSTPRQVWTVFRQPDRILEEVAGSQGRQVLIVAAGGAVGALAVPARTGDLRGAALVDVAPLG